MLFFSLQKLEALCKGEGRLLQPALHSYYFKIPKKGILSKIYSTNLSGHSFLLNPEPLLNDRQTDPSYITQYIRLAGRRDYAMYKIYHVKYLDLSFYPEVDIANIKHNPLLTIAQNKVYFKYEDN